MKIICLIRPEPPCVYFVNRIHEEHQVSLAVVETVPAREQLQAKLRSRGLAGVREACLNRARKRARHGKSTRDYERYFGDRWRALHDSVPIMECDDINAQEVLDRLAAEKPDLILDHGTSIVKDETLQTADLALNLHWGLSPYYRGTNCTEWALINWDPYNIGVTIHKLTKIIDGGSLLAQARATVEPQDTVDSINMQLTCLGTDLALGVIRKLERGEEIRFVDQDCALGYLGTNKQWSAALRTHVAYIERSGAIARMLKSPARRQKLPIVQPE